MNLADAIRQAAMRQAEEQGQKETTNMFNVPGSPESHGPENTSPASKQETESTVTAKAETPVAEPKPQAEAPAPKPEPKKPELQVAKAEEPELEDFDEKDLEQTPTWGNDTGKLTIEAHPSEAVKVFARDSGTGEPVEMPETPNGLTSGNVVRFEIFLSPEQLSCLFRALVATQHSMMTLREAANYLRIPAGTLEQLAQESKIPALLLEGRWRFPKSGIDEWVMLQSFRDGEVHDAA